MREIDLDSRRFELRGIEDNLVQQVRCTYGPALDDVAREWLDNQIRVSGNVEHSPDGKPRLVRIENVEFL